MDSFTVGIVGLGLIGASMAKSLKGYKNWNIIGFDTNEQVINSAIKDGAISQGYTSTENTVNCDIVIFATPPSITLKAINNCKYKSSAMVCDACGVKGFMDNIRDDIDFVGMHPMAGKEVGGYENSDNILFNGANLLLLKRPSTTAYACSLAEELGKAMGFAVLQWTDSKTHDKIIGFTSQMPHLVSAIIVRHPLYDDCHSFEGGSLNDFTRIACLDEDMWSELFYKNQKNLTEQCDFYINQLEKFRNMLNDKEAMREYLKQSRIRRQTHELKENC